MKVPRKSQKWTQEEDQLLLNAVKSLGTQKWIEVSKCTTAEIVRSRRAGTRQHAVHAAIYEGAEAWDQEGNVELGGGPTVAGVGKAIGDRELGGNRETHRGTECWEVSRALHELYRTGREERVSEEEGIEA